MFNICPHCNKEINIDPYRIPAVEPKPKEEVPKKPRWYTKMNWSSFFHNLWEYTIKIFWSSVLIAAVSCAIFCLFKVLTAPDKVDYCYVTYSQTSSQSWVLNGNVNWNFDRHLGSFPEVYLAQKYAQKINCPLDLTPLEEVRVDNVTPTVPTVASSGPFLAYPAPIQSATYTPIPSASTPELLP